MSSGRREFLKYLGTAAAASTLPASIARALAIPANNQTRSINDVEHVVFLMQENRSFDHYFGAMRGVRGFADPRAVQLPTGKSVWHQPDLSHPDGYLLPFRPDVPNLGLTFIEDTAHDWQSTHDAWNGGLYDRWVPNKGTTSMAYLTRKDIPYHYALADAFTVCDAYFCSLLGPTDPNRYHMWTGWVGNDGKNGGPVIDNAEAGYDWSTYPEKLDKAGISWKVYQDVGEGLDADHFWGWTGDAPYIGNYGDNSLLYFHQYQNSAAGSSLADKAKTGTNIAKSGTLFDVFRQDVLSGQLPQVSWIVAPEAYTEHGNWPPNYGAWYVSQMLDALTANPELWSKTVLFYMFDENDGFFDHIVPPTPPRSSAEGISTVGTTNELFEGSPSYPVSDFTPGPYGLGVRVPMIVISPWSKGGFVNSEVFDHTSLIRFLERRFGVTEENITPWRRTVAGDLTSTFDFASPNTAAVSLPDTAAYQPPNTDRYPDYVPTPPANQAMPQQEPGMRPARALPYELHVNGEVSGSGVNVKFQNLGKAGAAFHVRFADGSAPKTYTVAAGHETVQAIGGGGATYDFAVYGPNGFLRTFAGGYASDRAKLSVDESYEKQLDGITVMIRNQGQDAEKVSIFDSYTGKTQERTLQPGHTAMVNAQLHKSFGWYDLTVKAANDPGFARQLAGHVETGRPSMSDPAIGAAV